MKSTIIISTLVLFTLASCSPSIRFAHKKAYSGQRSIAAKQTKERQKIKEAKDLTDAFLKGEVPQKNYNSAPKITLQDDLIKELEQWIGTKYRFGGMDRTGVDCSALVQNVYGTLGMALPRTADDQFEHARIIDVPEPGDLVFFAKQNRITHVGIFVGNNQIIHASTSKGVIKQDLNTAFLTETFAAFGRVVDFKQLANR